MSISPSLPAARINGGSIDHMMMLPDGCWCLSDGNARVMYPCDAFDRQRIALISDHVTEARTV